MIFWGLYLSLFWALSIYSAFMDIGKIERWMPIAENLFTSLVISISVVGLFYAPIGQVFAPYLLALLPLSAYLEVSNAIKDIKSERIQEALEEGIPEDVLKNVAFITLSVTLLPGYCAAIMVIVKYLAI